MKPVTIKCDIMYRESKTGRLEIVDGKLIKNEVYTDKPLAEHPFPHPRTTVETILDTLRERVIPPERFNERMQEAFGMKEYNAYKMLRVTHGVDIDDFIWFKFDGETVEWKDVKVRG